MIALNSDNDGHYVLTPKPVLQVTPMLFEPEEVQSAISPNAFIAQRYGIPSTSSADLGTFWSRVLFTKQSDTTLKLLGSYR